MRAHTNLRTAFRFTMMMVAATGVTFAASQAHADTAGAVGGHELLDRLRRAEVRHGSGPRHLDRHRLPRTRGRAGSRGRQDRPRQGRRTPLLGRHAEGRRRRGELGRRQEDHPQGRQRLADRRHRQGPPHAHALARAQGQPPSVSPRSSASTPRSSSTRSPAPSSPTTRRPRSSSRPGASPRPTPS